MCILHAVCYIVITIKFKTFNQWDKSNFMLRRWKIRYQGLDKPIEQIILPSEICRLVVLYTICIYLNICVWFSSTYQLEYVPFPLTSCMNSKRCS